MSGFGFQSRIWRGMLENIKGISDWCPKDYKTIYKLWRQRIMKQEESNGDLEFTVTIRLGSKSSSH